ncbi:TPA: hypothetical protein N0F65_010006 [Lagenidium giganteum]|uniref:VTT domain-containing protein n=1 Tax=Lagenidium giganteum TaxID=4803 RepID=A0AAV2ZET6_9STRA|nr:TPA: hypothetical protein N0F65_010006 [Lagenidium giganteum]
MLALPLLLMAVIPLGIPTSFIEMLAVTLFGVWRGVFLCVIGKMLGGSLAFGIGRKLGRKRIGDYLQTKYPFFQALFGVLQGGDWKPLILVQLSGLPNFIKCYGLAITNVAPVRFLLTALVGALPYSIMWCLIGFETSDLLADEDSNGLSTNATVPVVVDNSKRVIVMVLAIALTVAALLVMAWYTRKQLKLLPGKVPKRSDNSKHEGATARVLPVSVQDDGANSSNLSEPLTMVVPIESIKMMCEAPVI